MKDRPGVMLYFDHQECIEELSDEEAGKLIKGTLQYAQKGTVPQFAGGLKLVWLMLKPRLDYDAQRYYKLCRQKSYAVYCREQEKKQLPKQTFDEWQAEQSLSDDTECYPSTTTNTTTTPTATTATTTNTTTTATAAATIPASPAEKVGHHGKNRTIRLTDADYLDLMDEIGLSGLCDTMLYAEPKAQELGYDTETLDWKAFLRKCWYTEVKPGSDQNKL